MRIAALAAMFFAGLLGVLQAADRPNILLIVSDDHGYGDVGAYGCRDIATPHLDALARSGVRFTSGYVSGPYCSPTRAGLMTGRYQTRFGHEFNPGPAAVPGKEIGLPRSEVTLPERLQKAGYRTGMVGKWHLGYTPELHPRNRGFDEFFGFLGGAHSYLNLRKQSPNPILRGFDPVDESEYLTDAFGREAVKFIESDSSRPWFLYLAFNAVHGPMDASPRHAGKFSELSGGRKTYATMLTAMDEAIGRVLKTLQEKGIEEDTLVLFVADNGGPEQVNSSDNGPLRGVKGQTWEGGIRVPFLMQWKTHVPAGVVFDDPVIQLDLVPTALAAAGVPADASSKFDGVDLLPYVRGEQATPPHEALYWRFGQQMAIRKGDWKLVRATGAGLEEAGAPLRRSIVQEPTGAHLFHLGRDIGESTNLADQEPEKVKELATAWLAWNRDNTEPRWFPGQSGARKAKRRKSR